MWEYIKKNKILLSICGVLLAVIAGLGILLGIKISKNKVLDANLIAATEQMKELETKNGDLLVERQSYVGTIDELEGIISTSKDELKDLQSKLDAKVLYISDLEGKINIHPSEVHDTTVVYRDSSFCYSFHFGDEWYNLDGHSQVNQYAAKTWVDSLSIDVPLKVGLTENWEIFATTPNPYVSFSSIEGAVLDKSAYLQQKKKQHWGFSVSAGLYGGYNFIKKGAYFGPGIGIGGCYMF